jgi:transposase-like protein
MAEGQSMTTSELVAKTLLDEHADFLKEAVAMVAAQLMETEIGAEIGAAKGEVSPGRLTHRDGYRPRAWETRVGEIELQIPRKRSGEAYFPSFLEPRKRSEQAIVAVVMEAYVNGVSTRKVDRLVEQLGIHGMTKDRVSALCRALDEQVEVFRSRPLEGEHPYLCSTPRWSRSAIAATSTEGARDRLLGPRVGASRGDRPRHRRDRDRGLLGRLPALLARARA